MAGNKDKIQLPTNTTDISTLVRYLKGIKVAEPLNNNTAQSVYQAVKATGRKQTSYSAKVVETGGKIPAKDTHTTGTLATYGLIRYIDNNRPANFVVSDLGCELIALYDDSGKPVTNNEGVQLYSNGKYMVMLLRVFSAWHETGKGRNIHPGKIMLQLMSDPDLDYYITEHDVAYFTSNSEFMYDSQYEEIKKSILEFRMKYDGVYGLTSTPCKAEIFMPTFVRNWGIFEKKEIFEISSDDTNPGHFLIIQKNTSSTIEEEVDKFEEDEVDNTESASEGESVVVDGINDTDPNGLGKSIDIDKLYKNLTHYVLANGAEVYCDMVFRSDGDFDWIYTASDETNQDDQVKIEDAVDLESDRISTGENVLLYGVPGAGKSWTIEHEYCDDEECMERLVFHPDYMYSDFVGQILPIVKKDDEGKEKVRYEFTPGPFTKIMKKAYENPTKSFYLIIEEINRGNAPAIFGEIFQLLDRKTEEDDKYKKCTSEYGITNANIANEVYGDENVKVRIPANLSIIGTMNTSDQNVFTLDTAFQRRWIMRMIPNSFSGHKFAKNKILDTEVDWQQFCEAVNEEILRRNTVTSSEDKRLGAYFVSSDDLEYTAIPDDCTERFKIKLQHKNARFAEKVLKYLWDDAFKFSHSDTFDTKKYKSLEKVVEGFNSALGNNRFRVFHENLRKMIIEGLDDNNMLSGDDDN